MEQRTEASLGAALSLYLRRHYYASILHCPPLALPRHLQHLEKNPQHLQLQTFHSPKPRLGRHSMNFH
ncbi:hypothetical protein A2U01_0038926, partial [Trifolium medium]|nr:hypothetical protein [Trifolium medium]